MNRRNFFHTLIGGVAASAAVRTWPFRVYSFPSEVKIFTLDQITKPIPPMFHTIRGQLDERSQRILQAQIRRFNLEGLDVKTTKLAKVEQDGHFYKGQTFWPGEPDSWPLEKLT